MLYIFKPNLSKLEKNKNYKKLIKVITKSRDRALRFDAFQILMRLDRSEAAKLLSQIINDHDSSICEIAIKSAGDMKVLDALPELIKRLSSDSNQLTKETIESVMKIKDIKSESIIKRTNTEKLDLLFHLLEIEKNKNIELIAESISTYGGIAVTSLEELLKSNNHEIQMGSLIALGKIRDTNSIILLSDALNLPANELQLIAEVAIRLYVKENPKSEILKDIEEKFSLYCKKKKIPKFQIGEEVKVSYNRSIAIRDPYNKSGLNSLWGNKGIIRQHIVDPLSNPLGMILHGSAFMYEVYLPFLFNSITVSEGELEWKDWNTWEEKEDKVIIDGIVKSQKI
ncbi:MAG: HEAT repeat domain-containing protein [Candidatus Zhuqueibacterota bacterium]